MSHNPVTGAKEYSPLSKATHWRKRGVAFLDSPLNVPVLFNIKATNTLYSADIDIQRVSDETFGTDRIGERHVIDWLLQDHHSSHPRVAEFAGKLVNVAGIPVDETWEARDFPDMLFWDGKLKVMLSGDEESTESDSAVDLGTVVGLTIVTDTEEYQVWPG